MLTAGALAAITVSACGGGSELQLPSTYELVRADGAALPAVLASDSACITHLIGATLHMSRRDYRSTYQIRRTCAQGDVHTAPDPGVVGRYRIRRDSIYFVDTEGDAAGAGTFGADTIVIRGPEHTLIFRRVPAPP